MGLTLTTPYAISTALRFSGLENQPYNQSDDNLIYSQTLTLEDTHIIHSFTPEIGYYIDRSGNGVESYEDVEACHKLL
jgi:hypothetical protein